MFICEFKKLLKHKKDTHLVSISSNFFLPENVHVREYGSYQAI